MRDLLILNKFPSAGKSKTRLGKTIGYKESAHVAMLLLEDLVRNASRVSNVTVVCPSNDICSFSEHYPGLKTYGTKKGLIHQLSQSMIYKYDNINSDKVIAITGDILASEETMDEWFSDLKNYDLLVGPTNDLGFYLAGLNKKFGGVFSGFLSENSGMVNFFYSGAISLFHLPKIKICRAKRDIDYIDDLRGVTFNSDTSSKKTLDYVARILDKHP